MADRHPEDIKSEIRKRGSSLSALADAHSLSRKTMSASVNGRVSGRCEQIIADFLGLHPSELWPSRYRDGQRIMGRRLSEKERAAA